MDFLTAEQVKSLLNFDTGRVTVKRNPQRFRCSCPFCDPPHKGKGKLNLHFDSNTYFCYRCGAKGKLEELLIDPVSPLLLSVAKEPDDDKVPSLKDQLSEIDETFKKWKEYSDLLLESDHQSVRQIISLMLKERKGWNETQLRAALRFPNVALSLLGENKTLPKILENRLIFRTTYGVQGRSLNWAATSKKYYTWSTDYPDSFVIEGDPEPEVLCEGTFDSLKLRLLGIQNRIIAVLGKEFFHYFLRPSKSYFIYPDTDWDRKTFVFVSRVANDRKVKSLSFFLLKEGLEDPSEATSLEDFREIRVIQRGSLDIDGANKLLSIVSL